MLGGGVVQDLEGSTAVLDGLMGPEPTIFSANEKGSVPSDGFEILC